MQRLFALFEVRNALVHPRRSGAKSISAYSHNVTEQDKELVGPKAAASYIVAVAELTVRLEPYMPGRSFIGEATTIAKRAVLDAHRKLLGDEILVVPDPEDAAPVPLLIQMQRRAAKRAR